jgi:SAM-dependent methyltransferase
MPRARRSRNWTRGGALLGVFYLLAGGPLPARQIAAPRLAPYVPTPQEVVDEMLTLAEVGPEDVLFDLGSGDGRIVITAARRLGARGVGVDIDPALVELARQNAAAAGVSHLVTFRVQDALTVDVADATVVALYLLPEGNARLRPRLTAQLSRGARIVSHSFDMGPEWPPHRTRRMYDAQGLPRILFLWHADGRVH